MGTYRYGTGKWKKIVDDETLGPRLTARDNKHVMDKWRHLHPKSESDTAQVGLRTCFDCPLSLLSLLMSCYRVVATYRGASVGWVRKEHT